MSGDAKAFRGATEPEFTAWLRRILAGILANTVRHYFGTQARDPRLDARGPDLLGPARRRHRCGLAGGAAASRGPSTWAPDISSRTRP
mgnify:CR=1 FL=1